MVMWSTRHRPTVFAAWLVLLAGSISVALPGVGQLGNDFGVPGSDSDRAVEMARHIDPHLSGTNAIVVLHRHADQLRPIAGCRRRRGREHP